VEYKKFGNDIMKRVDIHTGTQIATVDTFFDKEFHVELEISQEEVNIVDSIQVKATVRDYLGDVVENFDSIIFDLNGFENSITVIDGIATLDFSSEVSGTYKIKTMNKGIRNSEIEVVVNE